MRFSILIPVYNAGEYLLACLASLDAQTLRDFEVRLIDDGSTDTSGALCERFAAERESVYVLRRENRGTISTRAELAALAEGDYCLFLDSDDYLHPEALETLSRAIDDTGADCIFFGFECVKDGKTIQIVREEACLIEDRDAFYEKLLGAQQYNSMCLKCVRRSLLADFSAEEYRGERTGEDLIQSLYVYRRVEKALFLPDVLYCYVTNSQSTSHTVTADNFQLSTRLYEVVRTVLGEGLVRGGAAERALRTRYAQNLAVDVLTVERFSLPLREKRARLKELAALGADVLHGEIDFKKLGKKRLLYSFMRRRLFSLALLLAGCINRKNKASRA